VNRGGILGSIPYIQVNSDVQQSASRNIDNHVQAYLQNLFSFIGQARGLFGKWIDFHMSMEHETKFPN
jgi:hypothetical protein